MLRTIVYDRDYQEYSNALLDSVSTVQRIENAGVIGSDTLYTNDTTFLIPQQFVRNIIRNIIR